MTADVPGATLSPVRPGFVPGADDLRPAALGFTAFAALIAAADLVGWWAHLPGLVRDSPMVSMKPNTAVVMLLLAAVLGLQFRLAAGRLAGLRNLLVLGALALALATLVEYATGRSLRIDELLAVVPREAAGDPAGRMSIGSAADGLLLATALLALDAAPALAGLASGLGALLSLSALVGFLFQAAPMLGVPLLRSMAPRTALAFFALQIACILLRPLREPVRSLLHSARHHRTGIWFILATCTLPLLIGFPIAALYQHGWMEASFCFALLVVLLMGAQTWLVSRNSRSLALVEDKRLRLEQERLRLAGENQRQYAALALSQQHAEQSEALLRLITDSLPTLIAYLDPGLRYVRLNRTYEEWFGRPLAELEGGSLEEILGPSAANVRPSLLLALKGQTQQFETVLETRQGARTISVSQTPDVQADGSVRGVVVQAADITAQKRTEAALRQTEKLAAVGKLASSIAHEINNPLEAVVNLLYLAGISSEVTEIRGYLDTAGHELTRMSAIVNGTLRFHRQATRPLPTHPTELFHSVLSVYHGRLRNGRLRVASRHRASEPVTCLDGEIRQVLNNLVGNALDAMGDRPGRLYLRSQDATDWRTGRAGVVFTVADTGTGMSPQTRTSLFEAFYTTKGMNGTGLGLWVSKEIIDRHDGRLQLRTSQAPGHAGTAFRLFLPHQ